MNIIYYSVASVLNKMYLIHNFYIMAQRFEQQPSDAFSDSSKTSAMPSDGVSDKPLRVEIPSFDIVLDCDLWKVFICFSKWTKYQTVCMLQNFFWLKNFVTLITDKNILSRLLMKILVKGHWLTPKILRKSIFTKAFKLFLNIIKVSLLYVWLILL